MDAPSGTAPVRPARPNDNRSHLARAQGDFQLREPTWRFIPPSNTPTAVPCTASGVAKYPTAQVPLSALRLHCKPKAVMSGPISLNFLYSAGTTHEIDAAHSRSRLLTGDVVCSVRGISGQTLCVMQCGWRPRVMGAELGAAVPERLRAGRVSASTGPADESGEGLTAWPRPRPPNSPPPTCAEPTGRGCADRPAQPPRRALRKAEIPVLHFVHNRP